MRRDLKLRRGEKLWQWVERIAAACQGRPLDEVIEMISEVSKTSYLHGHNDAQEVIRKHQQ